MPVVNITQPITRVTVTLNPINVTVALPAVAIGGTAETAASIKTKYESNADTNAFTNAEKTKVGNLSGTNTGDQDTSGIATNAAAISALDSAKQDTLSVVSQVDAEAGTATDERIWTAQRVKQAIDALATSGTTFLDTEFAIIDSSSFFEASFGTSQLTANREIILPNFGFNFNSYFDSSGNQLSFQNNLNFYNYASNGMDIRANNGTNAVYFRFYSSLRFQVHTNCQHVWGPGDADGTRDVGIGRHSPGWIKVTNASSGDGGIACNHPAYDDDTAAGVAGLTTGQNYQTTGSGASPLNVAGIVMVKQ